MVLLLEILHAASLCWTADGASAPMHEAGCANLALLHRAVLLHMFPHL